MAVNLQIVQLFRPLNMSDWFVYDPVALTVDEDNYICGVRCEFAEAIITDEGLMIWRISGIPQKAESGVILEGGRMNNDAIVHVDTLKVDPVNLQCMPKRIVTRCAAGVVHPVGVLRLQPCQINADGDNDRERPKSPSIEPEDVPDAVDEPPTSPEIVTVAFEDEPPSASANGYASPETQTSSEPITSPRAPASPDPSASPEPERSESPSSPDPGWGPPECDVVPEYDDEWLCDPRVGLDLAILKIEPDASPRDDFDDGIGGSVSVNADGPLDNMEITAGAPRRYLHDQPRDIVIDAKAHRVSMLRRIAP